MKKLQLYSTELVSETCILIGIVTKKLRKDTVENNINELALLAKTANLVVKDRIIQNRKSLSSHYLLGKGKVTELLSYIKKNKINTLVFDDELSPAQFRNWEELTKLKIIDRSNLILDIFAKHARTYEAKLQVELAQLTYLLPRLTKQWTHLSRQVGGVGTKGPGEMQLETDRRLVRTRISRLKKDLKEIDQQRLTQRKKSNRMICVSIVGYTNSGKSTLLNRLTGANSTIEEKLFATLDTTTRRFQINEKLTILLSDTVGFINRIPHHLVASFRSTLIHTLEADFLVQLVDISDPCYAEHIKVVQEILKIINVGQKVILLVFNKVDKVGDEGLLKRVKKMYPDSVFISAKNGIRIEKLTGVFQKKIIELKLRH